VDGSHIRTLIMTFFYRQMPKLIEGGHLYIAQPPLYKISRGRSFQYLLDEKSFDRYMIKKISDDFRIKVKGQAEELKGEKFRKFLQRIIAKRRYIEILDRKNYPFFLIEALIKHEVFTPEFLKNQKKMAAFQKFLEAMGVVSVLARDEEHNLYELAVNFRVNGMTLTSRVNLSLVNSAEFRSLAKISKEMAPFKPPYEVFQNSESIKIENETKLLDYVYKHGKKGITIQRYKGLGEMTPIQLWETTMDPEVRHMLKVSIHDAYEADKVFSILMGDEVESRRNFIAENALEAQNLDV